MEALVLNPQFEVIAVMDTFESFIWTDRYMTCGDFEVYTLVSKDAIAFLREDNFLYFKDSEHLMVIENIMIKTDPEKGDRYIVSGRSLESILDRRVLTGKSYSMKGNLQTAIQKILNENFISPSDSARKVPNFIFTPSTDPYITSLVVNAQFNGDNIYSIIAGICSSYLVGFKIILTASNQFEFSLYSGADRSYDQVVNPYVVFSPEFDNLLNSNYLESTKNMKTIALVWGKGFGFWGDGMYDWGTMEPVAIPTGAGTGLNRRELFVDANDLQMSEDIDAETLRKQLARRGLEELYTNSYIKSFEGQVDTTRLYSYGKDFFMGDIVQVANEYGMSSKARIIEMIYSQDASGTKQYPTFSTLN